jgi:glucokinase
VTPPAPPASPNRPAPSGGLPAEAPAGHVAALDVGGTGMKAALVAPDGTVLHRARRRTPREEGPEAVTAAVLDFAADLCGRGAAALGVVVPGAIDEGSGTVTFAANLGWRDEPLRDRLTARLGGLPVALGHDVRAGGLAEGRLGAGRDAERFLFVALGTGIAGAIGLPSGANGQVTRVEAGAHGFAGEIGHVVVRPGGPECGCGRRGCLETLASAAAVTRAWAAASGDPAATAAGCAAAVAAGDPRAAEVWRAAVEALADGLLTGITLLDPAVLIVGGGLAEAGGTLFSPLRAAVRSRLTFEREPLIVPAALGDSAGCLGAALLAQGLLNVEVTA